MPHSTSPTAAPERQGSGGFLDLIERLGNRLPEPATLFVIGALLVMALSHVGAAAGWRVQAKRLAPVMAAQVDAQGQPVLDPETGEPVMSPQLDPHGRPVTQLVDNTAVNGGQPFSARSLLNGDGLYWAISSMVDNFVRFPPLGVVLVAILGVGVAERTGYIGAVLKAFMLAVPARFLTPSVVFLGVSSSVATDAGYLVLPPVAAALYKAAGRSPLAGIAAVFAGIAGGFNANLLVTSLDPLLAGLTGPAAQTVDAGYTVNPACGWWFMIASTLMLTLAGWFTTWLFVERRLNRLSPENGGPAPATADDTATQRLSRGETRAMLGATAGMLGVLAAFAALVFVPRAPFDDYLRARDGRAVTRAEVQAAIEGNSAGNARIAELMETTLAGRNLPALLPGRGDPDQRVKDPARKLTDAQRNNVPGTADHFDRWAESIVPMLLLLFVVPGLIYGRMTGVIRSGRDASRLMVEAMASMAPVIVLAFFAAQFIAYFTYSNLDKMVAYKGGEMLAGAGLGAGPLIVVFILVVAGFNLLIASMSAKYAMLAPIFVPMLMLVGISPELTQTAYRMGDSITNIITPLNAYLIIILVAVQRHSPRAGMGSLIAMMLPYTLVFGLVWIAMLLGWMWLDLPLGPDGPLRYAPEAG